MALLTRMLDRKQNAEGMLFQLLGCQRRWPARRWRRRMSMLRPSALRTSHSLHYIAWFPL